MREGFHLDLLWAPPNFASRLQVPLQLQTTRKITLKITFQFFYKLTNAACVLVEEIPIATSPVIEDTVI